MSNSFAKTRPQDQPYAIYSAGNFTFYVCKTYSKDPKKPYARFLVWASSPFTYGSMECGDTYAEEILSSARLVACEDEWMDVYGPYSLHSSEIVTPEEYLQYH
jgi:hypothetical protein